jgi:hypothetical protein
MSQLSRLIPTSGPGSGTVTSINFSGGLTSTPDPVTTTGVATIDQTNLTVLDGTVYWDTGTQLLHTTDTGTAGQVLTSQGVGLPPLYADASGGIQNIDGDTGTATGSTITIETGISTNNSGATFEFVNSGTVSNLNVSDGRFNTFIGNLAGNTSNSTNQSTAFGATALQNIVSGNYNNAFGNNCLNACTTGSQNVAVGTDVLFQNVAGTDNIGLGFESMFNLNGGSYNVCMGTSTGLNYTSTESSNILLGFQVEGAPGESNALRIGANTSSGTGGLTSAYIAGINSNAQSYNTSNINIVTINSSGDQLGVMPVTDGNGNVILGLNAGTGITGEFNVAIGDSALPMSASGNNNVAIGLLAAQFMTSGSYNSALGAGTCNVTSGTYNVCVGYNAGTNYVSTESHNININNNGTVSESNVLRIGAGTGTGTQQLNQAFVSGIQGITVTGAAVLVSSSDQLGVAVSSRKFKENIRDMDNYSSQILNLRPTIFNYKGSEETTGGLIAEEVAESMPSLVVYDKSGDPQTVKYHEIPALLLNELQKAIKRIEYLEDQLKG